MYRSRISVLLTTIIVGALTPSTILAFDGNSSMGSMLIALLVPLFVLFCFISTRYAIVEGVLRIKNMGVIAAKIDIASILSVKRSYNPISSPAISLKRLEVKYISDEGVKSVLISPVREFQFVEQLKKINPDIAIHINDKVSILRFWDWDI